MTETDKRSFALGYLACLRMIRTLHSERGLSWERAVTEAGKKLRLFLEGGDDVEAEDNEAA